MPRRLYQSVGGDWTPGQDVASLGASGGTERNGRSADTGALDPIGGQTFQEQGLSALNQHRSQGMALLPGPGRFVYYYRLIEGSVAIEPPDASPRAASSRGA